VVLATTAAAGSPEAVGSLVGSRNATLDGHAPLAHTALLNGDKITVKDGLAMVTLNRGNRMILGRDSAAVFLRESDKLTVRMDRGRLSLYHPPDGSRLRVTAGSVTVAPAGGPGTLGDLVLANGLLVVTARDGSLRVEKDGATTEVEKGRTLTVAATAGRSPTPGSPGHAHLRHVFGRRSPVGLGIAAGSAGGGVSAIALARASRQVSPVIPGP